MRSETVAKTLVYLVKQGPIVKQTSVKKLVDQLGEGKVAMHIHDAVEMLTVKPHAAYRRKISRNECLVIFRKTNRAMVAMYSSI